jgi:hypothetical protein
MQNGECRIESIEIYDAIGTKVFSTTLLPFSSGRRDLRDEVIDVSTLIPGIYFISFVDNKHKTSTKKFVKM